MQVGDAENQFHTHHVVMRREVEGVLSAQQLVVDVVHVLLGVIRTVVVVVFNLWGKETQAYQLIENQRFQEGQSFELTGASVTDSQPVASKSLRANGSYQWNFFKINI